MRKVVMALLALVVAVPLLAQERWDLTRARVSIRFNAGLMRDIGFRVGPSSRIDGDGYAAYDIANAAPTAAAGSTAVLGVLDGPTRTISMPIMAPIQ